MVGTRTVLSGRMPGRVWFVVAGLALATASAAEAQVATTVEPVDSVTLDEAVARALDVNPQVVQAETSLGTAEWGTRQAYASFLPTLSVSSGASLSSTERYDPELGATISGSSDSYSAGVNASMDLFSGGRNLASVRSARASVRAAEATLVTRRFSVALATKQSFFAVLRAEELIKLNEERIRQAEEQLAAAERRLQVGSATRSDVLRSRLELTNAKQAMLNAQTQRRTSMYALGQAVGVVGAVAAVRPETLEPQPLALDFETMRQIVLEESPSVRSAEANVDVAHAGVAQARAQYFPTLGVSGGYNWSNQTAALQGGRTSWRTSLGLSFPVFNGFQREVSMDRAHAQLTVAEAQAEDATRAALANLEGLIAALALAQEQLTISQEGVDVAREDYRVQQERYQHGAATILELVSSQIALIQAEYDLINARYDYQISKAELESLVGREL